MALLFFLYFAPTPGSSGFAEVFSLSAMAAIVPAGLAPYYNLVWRASTVYLPAGLGLLFLVLTVLRDTRNVLRRRNLGLDSYRFSLEWEGLKGKDRGMRLHDPEACEVGGTGCLMRDKWLAYVFLGRLLEKQRKGILAHILGQFI